jgi:hypothetical protein
MTNAKDQAGEMPPAGSLILDLYRALSTGVRRPRAFAG